MAENTNDTDDIHKTQDNDTPTEGKVGNHTEHLSEEEKEARKAIEAIRKFANEDDNGELSLKSIIGGDFLMSKFVIRQIVFVIFVVLLMILYTGNRYDSQQDTILIDSLRTELQSVKYNVLTQSSELMNMIRQSNVEERLKYTKDSLLHNSSTPPFLIKINDKEDTEQAVPETREIIIGEGNTSDQEGTNSPDGQREENNSEDEQHAPANANEEKSSNNAKKAR